MTTSPVVTITDELVADLQIDADSHDAATEIPITAAELRGLLSERAELKLDAERLSWMIDQECVVAAMNGTNSPMVYRVVWPYDSEFQSEWYPSEREAIDQAMQERQE